MAAAYQCDRNLATKLTQWDRLAVSRRIEQWRSQDRTCRRLQAELGVIMNGTVPLVLVRKHLGKYFSSLTNHHSCGLQTLINQAC
jgi:hypothetical protein